MRQEKLDTDREEMSKNFIVFGIDRDNNELRVRLRKRIEKMMSEQLFDEMRGLEKKYGVQIFEIAGNIYKISWEYLRGILPYNEAIEQAFYKDYHLAKRQLTWFRRNPEIIWCNENEIIARVLKIFTHS